MHKKDKDFMKRLAKARELFYQGNDIDFSSYGVRPVIMQSWERSRAAGVEKNSETLSLLSLKELEKVRKNNSILLETAISNIDFFHENIRDSLTNIILTDANGIVLYSKGTATGFDGHPSVPICGVDVSEKCDGTTAMGICLIEKRAVYVTGSEHYKSVFDNWHCTTAPIFDAMGVLIGTVSCLICLSDLHTHTLGMVAAVSKAISEQIKLHLLLHKHRTTLELINEAVIVLDKKKCISEINSYAQKIFKTNVDVLGSPVSSILRDDTKLWHIDNSSSIYDQEITLTLIDGSKLYCTLSSSKTADGSYIINLRERKRIQYVAKNLLETTARFTFDDILGESASIRKIKEMASVVASSNSSIMILGESGVGKELFAQAIHNSSSRKDAPFVAINCGAIPKDLVQSELFGYEPGTFTGASKEGMIGKFEIADGGTIFLDEIGDMSLDVQVNLLRVLQESTIMRIGGKVAKKINVRVIAATHRNLLSAINIGLFRQDLYYRLNVVELSIPPLRERVEDIPVISQFFLEKYQAVMGKTFLGFTPESIAKLMAYQWPGNIRELENVIERASIIGQTPYIQAQELPPEVFSPIQLQHTKNTSISPDFLVKPQLLDVEKQEDTQTFKLHKSKLIIDALIRTGGNIRSTAKILGISRGTLYSHIKKYGIDTTKFRL